MSADRPARRLAAALLRKQLDQILDLLDNLDAAGEIGPDEPLAIANANGTWKLELKVHRLPVQGALPGLAPVTPTPIARKADADEPKLTRIHAKLLEKADPAVPTPAKALIARAGYKANSYAWEAITYLSRLRLLIRTPDGYLRAPAAEQHLRAS